MRSIRWWLFIALSILLAAFLTALPLPDFWRWFRPQWFMLWVVFCQLQFPRQFNPWYACGAGLLVDALLGSLLGMHALVFSLMSYITALLRPRFVAHPFWQQMGKVFLLMGLGLILLLWSHVFIDQNPHTLWYWMGALTSSIIWPVWVGVLTTLSRCLGTTQSLNRPALS